MRAVFLGLAQPCFIHVRHDDPGAFEFRDLDVEEPRDAASEDQYRLTLFDLDDALAGRTTDKRDAVSTLLLIYDGLALDALRRTESLELIEGAIGEWTRQEA